MVDFMKLKRLVGYTVVIVTDDGEYEGNVRFVIPETGQVTLARVLMLPKRLPLCGTQNYFQHELKSYRVIEGPKNPDKKETSTRIPDVGQKLVKLRPPPLKSVYINKSQRSNVEASLAYLSDEEISETNSGPNGSNYTEELIDNMEYVLKLPEKLNLKLPKDIAVIDAVDNDFYDAVNHIEEQKVIGVSFHGVLIGRSGELCWIGVSTNCCTFLFDICTLEINAFKNGLKRIFEEPNIQKVIHDCRQPSDSLYHQYDTKLSGVFDTQVSDAFITMQENSNGRLPFYTNGLATCLSRHLKLTEEDIFIPEIHQASMKEDLSIWKQRPISNDLKDAAIKSVIYLKELRNALHDAMLRSYTNAVDFYLSHIRDASLKEIDLEQSSSYRMPQGMRWLGIQTIVCKDFQRKTIQKESNISRNCQTQNPLDLFVKNFDMCHEEKSTVTKALPCTVNCNSHMRSLNRKECPATDNSLTSKSRSLQQSVRNRSSASSSSRSSTSEGSDVSMDEAVSPIIWPKIPSSFSSRAQLIPAGMEYKL